MPDMIPGAEAVLAWRWRLASVIRLAAACLIAWMLWGCFRILVGQIARAPITGTTPFGYLFDDSHPASRMQRIEFFEHRGREGGAIVLGVLAFILARRISGLILPFPRPMRRCAGCGYSLERLDTPRCPECGLDLPVTGLTPALSAAPPPAPPGTPSTPS